MDNFMWLIIAVGVGFFAYLLYTRQFMWLFGVMRNMLLGVGGILAFNFVLAGLCIAVGINAVTALVVGLLGVPGFLLLYASQVLIG